MIDQLFALIKMMDIGMTRNKFVDEGGSNLDMMHLCSLAIGESLAPTCGLASFPVRPH